MNERRTPGERVVNLRERLPETGKQLRSRQYRPLVKLLLPLSAVKGPADAANDPLPRVPRKMQEQVSNTIRFCACSPPDLFVVQALKAMLDFRQVLSDEQRPGFSDECLCGLVHRLNPPDSVFAIYFTVLQVGAARRYSSPLVPGGRLCLALRMAGRARSSGLA